MSGWGNWPQLPCLAYRPEKRRDLDTILSNHPGTLIARGLGRSYGDASLGAGGTVLCERFDRFIAFDPDRGTLRAEAGVTLADILDVCAPQGWIPPVMPGTKHVSLGGAIACDIHGKNHFSRGSFGDHVTEITLRLAHGEHVSCSPRHNTDLFYATLGGMGLTGIVEEVSLQLAPLPSLSLRVYTRPAGSIEAMVEAFRTLSPATEYAIGWIDHFAQGTQTGAGLFEEASHVTVDAGGQPCEGYRPASPTLTLPLYTPAFALNRTLARLHNRWHARRANEALALRPLESCLFPLDAVGRWNRLYGKRGLLQYQCLIPEGPYAAANLRHMLAALQKARAYSFLAVLKYHRRGRGFLSYPDAGFSLALDFPNTPRTRKVLAGAGDWLAGIGGRVYLAKDALLTPGQFQRMYAATLPAWRRVALEADPAGRFASALSHRLQLSGTS